MPDNTEPPTTPPAAHPAEATAELWIGLYDAQDEAESATVLYFREPPEDWQPLTHLRYQAAGHPAFLAEPFDHTTGVIADEAGMLAYLIRLWRQGAA